MRDDPTTSASARGYTARVALLALAGLALAALLVRRARRTPDAAATRRALTRRGPGPATQSLVPVSPADADMGEAGRNDEERLEEALQETFPGSDPISTRIE